MVHYNHFSGSKSGHGSGVCSITVLGCCMVHGLDMCFLFLLAVPLTSPHIFPALRDFYAVLPGITAVLCDAA
jgi:hypothetical protein